MTQIGKIIPQFLAPIKELNKQQRRNKYKPSHARFKLKFWYRDGNEIPRYSYDFSPKNIDGVKQTIENEFLGLTTLMELVKDRTGLFKTAMIWCTLVKNKKTRMNENDGIVEHYNYEVLKYIGNQKALINPTIQFENHKLILDRVRKCKLVPA